jgi:hypothetical protein
MAPQSVEIARNATGNGAGLATAKKARKRAESRDRSVEKLARK